MTKPHLNGMRGTVRKFVKSSGRSLVQVDDGQGVFEFKQDNLSLADMDDEEEDGVVAMHEKEDEDGGYTRVRHISGQEGGGRYVQCQPSNVTN